jgi:Tfp pilus assembly protein PilV
MNSLRSQRGIGLIEIIVAMLVFAIGITAALRTLPTSNRATSHARNLTIATNLAQEQLERLMGSPFTDAALSAGGHVDPNNPLENHFTRSWSVADNSPVSGMKRIDVTVSFNSGNADSLVTLSTYITSRR